MSSFNRGADGLLWRRLPRQGNRGILSTPYYLNLDHPTSYYYLADPLGNGAATLTPKQKARILGGEAAMWSVFVTAENINKQIRPYLAAIAERFWSPQQVRDVNSMYRGLPIISVKLEYYGLNSEADVNEILQRMSGDPDSKPLKVLASVVAPPTGYERYALEGGKSYTVFTPLNRLVDAVPPESEKAREFPTSPNRSWRARRLLSNGSRLGNRLRYGVTTMDGLSPY